MTVEHKDHPISRQTDLLIRLRTGTLDMVVQEAVHNVQVSSGIFQIKFTSAMVYMRRIEQKRSENGQKYVLPVFCQEDTHSRVDSFKGTNNATLDARFGRCNSSRELARGFGAGMAETN